MHGGSATVSEVVHYQWRIQDLQTRDKDEPPHAPRSSALAPRCKDRDADGVGVARGVPLGLGGVWDAC